VWLTSAMYGSGMILGHQTVCIRFEPRASSFAALSLIIYSLSKGGKGKERRQRKGKERKATERKG